MIPFQPSPSIDLDQTTPGLESVRQEVIADDNLLAIAKRMGERYIDANSCDHPGARLLHGDYYPGSFLRRHSSRQTDGSTFYVIDPEFCFVGPAEFDLGILLAHAVFCGIDRADAKEQILAGYNAAGSVSHDLWQCFAGIEILRRLLGVAQLPLDAPLDTKRQWIDVARAWIR